MPVTGLPAYDGLDDGDVAKQKCDEEGRKDKREIRIAVRTVNSSETQANITKYISENKRQYSEK
jgi:hypothetical protein